jgi:hypothetical protein
MTPIVGRTPRSARVPPDPPFANEISLDQPQEADGSVSCGPGGPPHQGKLSEVGRRLSPEANHP